MDEEIIEEPEIIGEQLDVPEEIELEPEPEPKPVKPQEPDPAIAERARIQGWVPKEEFRGDKERWITAEEFVERADNMMPILKSVNKKLENKLTTIEKELKAQKELTKKMVKINAKYTTDFYDSRLETIKTQKLKAVQDGDIELYQRLEAEESKIEKPEAIAEPEEDLTPQEDPEFTRWKDDNNHWFGKDKELTDYANIISQKLATEGHSYKAYEFCDVVKERLKVMFPDKFGPKTPPTSGPDEPKTRGAEPSKGKGKGWNDLPQDAKNQCAKLVASVPNYTKEKYIKDYFEEA